MSNPPTALIADDEDLPRAELRRMLAVAWPELQVVAECEDGPAAVEAMDMHAPQIAFLDIRMPGMNGLDVARAANGRCHTVFTTAYDSHAVAAFDAGAVVGHRHSQAAIGAAPGAQLHRRRADLGLNTMFDGVFRQ